MCMDSTSEQRDKRRRMDIEAVDHNDFPVIPISNSCPFFLLRQSFVQVVENLTIGI